MTSEWELFKKDQYNYLFEHLDPPLDDNISKPTKIKNMIPDFLALIDIFKFKIMSHMS